MLLADIPEFKSYQNVSVFVETIFRCSSGIFGP